MPNPAYIEAFARTARGLPVGGVPTSGPNAGDRFKELGDPTKSLWTGEDFRAAQQKQTEAAEKMAAAANRLSNAIEKPQKITIDDAGRQRPATKPAQQFNDPFAK